LPSLADLRRAFYNGGADAEYAALMQFYTGGYTFNDVYNVAKDYHNGLLGGGGGGGIPATTFTAKGQLLIATAAGVVGVHAVPAIRDQTIVADPATADGWIADFALDRGEAYARPTGAIAETFSRRNQLANITNSGTASGTLRVIAIFLPKDVSITSISFMSAATAGSAMTNQWFALLDQNMNVLGKTVDDGAGTWNSNAIKTLNISGGPFVTTYAGLYYLGIVVVGTTLPTLSGFIDTASGPDMMNPVMAGESTGGLTDPTTLGPIAAAIGGQNQRKPWAFVS